MTENKYEYFEPDFFIITRNMARCKLCNDMIISNHRHDYVGCSCGEITVDGGVTYMKRSAISFVNFEDLSESRKFTKEEFLEYIDFRTNLSNSMDETSSTFHTDRVLAAKYFMNLWYPEEI
jgi:hypothetical protein